MDHLASTVIQAVLGLLLSGGGLLKLTLPYAKYSSLRYLGWAKEFKPAHIRVLGVLEMSGGVGLAAPLYFHSLIMLAPFAAVGVALYMSGAIAIHLRRSEYLEIAGILLFFLAPALFVAYSFVALWSRSG